MGKFCKFCGKKVDGMNCDCGNQPEKAGGYAPPTSYVLDSNSGLYYSLVIGQDGAQVVTWFDPNTGKYEEVTYPAEPAEPAAAKPVSTEDSPIAAKPPLAGAAPFADKSSAAVSGPALANPVSGEISPKKKTIMIILGIFGFHLGFQYFYIGITKKGFMFLFLYWPFMVLGWIFFFVGYRPARYGCNGS